MGAFFALEQENVAAVDDVVIVLLQAEQCLAARGRGQGAASVPRAYKLGHCCGP